MAGDRLKVAALFFVSIVVSILLLEVIVRVFDVAPRPLDPLPIPSYRLSENPVIRYEYLPSYRASLTPYDQLHIGFDTNEEGFRDRRYQRTKEEGTYRIIVIGDSTTVGNGIRNVEDVFAKRLERLMNRLGGGKKYEVMNMGVGGYHTVQEVETLRVKGLDYAPDTVVLVFCTNDFDTKSDGNIYRNLLKYNPRVNIYKGPSVLRALVKNSRLAFVVYFRVKSLFKTKDWYEENVLKGESPVEVGFRELSRLREKYGFNAVIYVLPVFKGLFSEYNWSETTSKVMEIADGFSGIDAVDTLPYFQVVNDSAPKFSYDGVHMNEYGHDLFSMILYNDLVRRFLRPVAPEG